MSTTRPTNDDADELVPLTRVGPMEANIVRAALESAGIFSVLQGEHGAALYPRSGLLESVGVLVRRRDLDSANEVIAQGEPVLEGPGGPDIEGAICAVHERPAKAPCDRCGVFLCDACGTLGDPPLCEDCVAAESRSMPEPKWPWRMSRTTRIALQVVLVVWFASMLIGAIVRALGARP